MFRIKSPEREGKSRVKTRARARTAALKTSKTNRELHSYLGWFHRVSSVFIRLLYLKDSRRRRRVFVTLSVLIHFPTKMSPHPHNNKKRTPKTRREFQSKERKNSPSPPSSYLCGPRGQGREEKTKREILTSGKKQLNPSNKSSWPLSNFFTRLTTSAVSYLMRLEIGNMVVSFFFFWKEREREKRGLSQRKTFHTRGKERENERTCRS